MREGLVQVKSERGEWPLSAALPYTWLYRGFVVNNWTRMEAGRGEKQRYGVLSFFCLRPVELSREEAAPILEFFCSKFSCRGGQHALAGLSQDVTCVGTRGNGMKPGIAFGSCLNDVCDMIDAFWWSRSAPKGEV